MTEDKPEITPAVSGIDMFKNRIRRNLRVWRKRLAKQNITCYRLYDADLHEYNAAIDFYEGQWLVVSEYAPPKTIEPEKAEQRLRDMLLALTELLGIEAEYIFLKQRAQQKGTAQYERMDYTRQMQLVRENGLMFYVNFLDFLDTGIFLDHRLTRQLIREWAQGKDFLNLFAYTGTASVYAAAGGAKATTTLDASNTYLEWAQKNMAQNGFPGPEHRYIRDNCLNWLQFSRQSYDLIFLDPPTFSNSKTYGTAFSVLTDHAGLIRSCMKLLRPDGKLIFSNNFRSFILDEEIETAYKVKNITKQTIPFDFERNPKIHHCFIIEHKS
jgi:23S rRNA (guanine2445-N2)-methyltransferase / 23S rRNA (guanine2069-N7)-methyltransferase